MAVQIVISAATYLAIAALIKSGVELIGTFTDEELIQMAADQEARSAALQKRQEEGQPS